MERIKSSSKSILKKGMSSLGYSSSSESIPSISVAHVDLDPAPGSRGECHNDIPAGSSAPQASTSSVEPSTSSVYRRLSDEGVKQRGTAAEGADSLHKSSSTSSLKLPGEPDGRRRSSLADLTLTLTGTPTGPSPRASLTDIPKLLSKVMGHSEEEFTEEMGRYYYMAKKKLFIHPYGNHVSSIEGEIFGDAEDEDDENEKAESPMNQLNPSSLLAWMMCIGTMAGMAGVIAFMAEVESGTEKDAYSDGILNMLTF